MSVKMATHEKIWLQWELSVRIRYIKRRNPLTWGVMIFLIISEVCPCLFFFHLWYHALSLSNILHFCGFNNYLQAHDSQIFESLSHRPNHILNHFWPVIFTYLTFVHSSHCSLLALSLMDCLWLSKTGSGLFPMYFCFTLHLLLSQNLSHSYVHSINQ